MKLSQFLSLAVIIAVIGGLFSSFEIVNPGERALVVKLGKIDRTLDQGFHMVNPFTSDIVVMDVQTQLLKMENVAASSSDLQEVGSTVEVNFHLDPERVASIYEEVGKRYIERILFPAVQESVKAGTAKYTAEEQINKRSEVKAAIKEDLTPRLEKFGIVLDDLSITDFSFSAEFDRAIEAKQVAEQNAKKAENDLKRVEFEQQQNIEKFKAEAESTKLQVQALQNSSKIIELRKVEAMLKIADGVSNWKGSLCLMHCK